MHVVRIGSGTLRAAPVENGPHAEILVGEEAADGRLAAAHVTLPPGGLMPEHDHGDAAALVFPRSGRLLLASGERREILDPGAVATIGVGERVLVENAGSEPASLLAVFAPAGFVRSLAAWPEAGPEPE